MRRGSKIAAGRGTFKSLSIRNGVMSELDMPLANHQRDAREACFDSIPGSTRFGYCNILVLCVSFWLVLFRFIILQCI